MSNQKTEETLPATVPEKKEEIVPLTFEDKAHALLTAPEYNVLKAYIDAGKPGLAQDTATVFFRLFLNGNDCKEIWRLNQAFPYESILWARIQYDWDRSRQEHISSLMGQVKDKVAKAQLEVTDLLASMLTAANKQHGDKVKKYLQTGNVKDLDGALNIDSINGMLRIIEGLQKITGQDRIQKIKTENTQNLNVNVNATVGNEQMDAETAAEVLAAVAKGKRKKYGDQK